MATNRRKSGKKTAAKAKAGNPRRGKTEKKKPAEKRKPADATRPFVKPGQPLGYVDKLKGRGLWPPKRVRKRGKNGDDGQHEKGPTTTPYLVVPAVPGDPGVRPISGQQALYNRSVQIIDGFGNPVLSPVSGSTYRLRCRVTNRGGAGAYGGIIEFYVAPPATLDNAATTPGATLPAKGYAGFVAAPGATVVVDCPHTWTPTAAGEATNTVEVQAYDAFVDQVTHRFDARRDRHVGRRDHIPDFSGVWEGMESGNTIHGTPTRIRIVVTQDYLNVSAGFYEEVGGGIPASPQSSASSAIFAGQALFAAIEYIGPSNAPQAFAESHWTVSLTPTGLLHFTHHKHYLMPGDTRPDWDTTGDLRRV
jgi:hypothetical protein